MNDFGLRSQKDEEFRVQDEEEMGNSRKEF